MPILVKIQLPKGKNKEQISRAFSEVNDVLCDIFDVQGKDVRITINEMDLNRYSVGGTLMFEKDNPFE